MNETTEESTGSVVLKASVSTVRTDFRGGGFRVTFDIPENYALKVARLLQMFQKNVELAVVLLPEDD